MNEEVLTAFIRQYDGEFVWQGGEPTLLGLDFYKKVLKLQKEHHPGKQIKNSLQTNGTLLDDKWCEFLKENDFLVGISLDGPKEVHELYRPSHDKVMRGLRLLKKYGVEFNVLACVGKETAKYPLEVYHFFKEEGVEFIQFTAIVEKDNPATVEPEAYGDFLIAIFEEWVRAEVGKIFVMNFEWALNTWVGKPSPICLFSETCGSSLVLEHNGDVYSCDHFVYPENYLGNILKDDLKKLAELPKQIAFGASKKDGLPEMCRSCHYLFACRGECPKRKQYLCAGYLKYFRHIDKTMRVMRDRLKVGIIRA